MVESCSLYTAEICYRFASGQAWVFLGTWALTPGRPHSGPVRWKQLPPIQRRSGCCDQGAESPQDSQVSEFQCSFLLDLSKAPSVSLQLSLVVTESFLLPFLLSLLPTHLLSCSPHQPFFPLLPADSFPSSSLRPACPAACVCLCVYCVHVAVADELW